MSEKFFHKALFFSLLAAYPLAYAPFGINETDGGFITGLAWQVLQGKQLYVDVFYVRPPLTVWLRALELRLLPTDWAVLAERVFFYWKVGLAAWLTADVLSNERRKWLLASLGFIVSAHCYPAAAWHTVDGVLFASFSLWLFFKGRNSLTMSLLAGVSAAAAMLCKQSFYPLPVALFAGVLVFRKSGFPVLRFAVSTSIGLFGSLAAVILYLRATGAWPSFVFWTAGAGSSRDFLQHGFLDFLRISPLSAGFVAAGLAAGFGLKSLLKKDGFDWPFSLAVAGLIGGYVIQVVENQSFTPPFGQSRLLFDAGAGLLAVRFFQKKITVADLPLAAFLSVSWMSAISWGYNLPILCGTPLVFGLWEISRPAPGGPEGCGRDAPGRGPLRARSALLAGLVFAFWLAYQHIYRDGRRADMTEPMDLVFPKLKGIYSDRETRDRYLEVRRFFEKHGPNVAVVPSFPLADFVLDNPPVLPVDWEVGQEVNGHNELIVKVLAEKSPTVLIEKSYGDELLENPKLGVAQWVVEHFELKEEGPNFWVYQKPGS